MAMCKTKKRQDKVKGKVNFVEPEDEFAFSVNSNKDFEKIQVTVGGQKIPMIVDSGASANIVDQELWEKLRDGN